VIILEKNVLISLIKGIVIKKDYNILIDLKMTLRLSDATQKHVDYVLQNINNHL
jgi:hypothetical protein